MKSVKEMSNKEYDEFMCKEFPVLFKERNLPMSETCMCWGFDIPEGWHELLYKLCKKIDLIFKTTGIEINFVQIKEKFGGGRFYYKHNKKNSDLPDEEKTIWMDIISELICNAEMKCETTCEKCGEYFNVDINITQKYKNNCPCEKEEKV